MKQLSFIGGSKGYINLREWVRGLGGEHTLLACTTVLEMLHLPENEFQVLAGHGHVGR